MSRMRIGIVAGESSGDILGAHIIRALQKYYPDAIFEGVAGPRMLDIPGVMSLLPMENLSVMGFTEVFCHFKKIVTAYYKIKKYFLDNPPDMYIGIDSPDFNLRLEKILKKAGIKTIHCNSPTIWAWRANRIFGIKKAVDLMLVLFPFEPDYYRRVTIPVCYIGHPLADIINNKKNIITKITINNITLALLPGSRQGEIQYIGPVLLQAAKMLYQKYPDIKFITPMVNQARFNQFEKQWKLIAPELPLTISLQNGRDIMTQADMIALASGTATLEALLLKKPMVVVYKVSRLSYWIGRLLIKIKQVSLPNILAGEALVPELLQDNATPDNIVRRLEEYLLSPEKINYFTQKATQIHATLQCNSAERAAKAIYDFCGDK